MAVGEEEKDCAHYENLFYETMERFIATKEGFAELVDEVVRRVGELLEKANEEHVLMPMVGVIAARVAATVYATLRRLGAGREEALREAEAQLCGVYRYALRLLREMVESGILDGDQDEPATDEHQ